MENVITILGAGSLFHQIDITLSDTIMLMAIIQYGTNEPFPALPTNRLHNCTKVSVVSMQANPDCALLMGNHTCYFIYILGKTGFRHFGAIGIDRWCIYVCDARFN
ncbi:hypothetical protein [Peribacillus simplex]|uniref:hypothetical protein n=1 Tax=Peribacillus simplex TaxID=1478 RepID=UPI003D2E18C0